MADAKTWSKRVAAWRASGLSAPAFARRSRLSASTLRYWAWKLGRESEGFVRVTTAPAEPREVTVALEVGGVRVVVSRDFDREALAQVLDVLRGRG